MPDPNVVAAKGYLSNTEHFLDCIAMGLLPIARQSAHPTIVFRWGINHIVAPARFESSTGGEPWKPAFWVESWVFALFSMRNSLKVFENAWTTLQENKPMVLSLKMDYEEALEKREKRLALLTEFRMGLTGLIWILTQEELMISIDQNLRQVQRELDKLEG